MAGDLVAADPVARRAGVHVRWLNTQSHRWDRFARMLRRRGATIDQYATTRSRHTLRHAAAARVDNCVCRHNPRDF